MCASLILSLFAASLSATEAAQGTKKTAQGTKKTAPGPPLSFQGESSVSWVLVPVVVRGKSGHVRDLRAEDFRLIVEGETVPIMSFESGSEAPVRLIHLQDLSGSMANGGKMEASRAALRCILADSRPGDEFALVTFSANQTTFDVPFTGETSRLESALKNWSGHGTTALHDALARLPEVRAGDRSLRQAAVLVTDGGDNASTLEPDEVRGVLRAAELPVYVLDLRAHLSQASAEPESFGHVLRIMASATGGRYRAVESKAPEPDGMNAVGSSSNDIVDACEAILEDLRYQYVLGFKTRGVGSSSFRRIQVEVVKKRYQNKRLRLSHRHGYQGGPPDGVPTHR